LEIEECGAFIIVEGVVSLANQLTGCSMIGSSPAFAGVWFRGSNSARFKATSWSIFTSDYVLWGVLGSTYVGAANGNMVGIDIDQPQTNGQIVHGLVNLYDVVSVDSNAIKVTRPEMSFVRVAANANAINSIIDEHSVGTVFRAGQIITLQPIGGTIVVADGAGNIVLSQGENYTLANNAFGADRLTLQWDVISQKWIEIARSEINHPWIKVTSATTMRIPNVATHGDNTAAKAAGLVDGDLYRGATGALFVVYT
jgi:hypothetical protein